MAEKDHVLNQLLEDKERFADLFNAKLFQGEQVLKPEMLQQISGKSGIIYVDKDGQKRTLQRQRDVIMEADFGACFALFACESQMEVHYAMPIRCMLYDALSYTDQVRELEKKHKEAGDKMTGAEFLSGMTREDRIVPVFSVVLYLGKDQWDGSRSLHELMTGGDEERGELFDKIKIYLPDYRMNLIEARRVEDIQLFKSSLQHFFGMLQYDKDKNGLYDYVQKHKDEIKNMDDASMMAALVMLGEQNRLVRLMEESNGKEDFDMCKAIDDLIEAGVEQGENSFALLTEKLLKDLRTDDLLRATGDKAFRAELYVEYGVRPSVQKQV